LYQSFVAGGNWKAQSMPFVGGPSEDAIPGGLGGVDFNWTPDGSQVIFSLERVKLSAGQYFHFGSEN
jgi:hypothetical protein